MHLRDLSSIQCTILILRVLWVLWYNESRSDQIFVSVIIDQLTLLKGGPRDLFENFDIPFKFSKISFLDLLKTDKTPPQ